MNPKILKETSKISSVISAIKNLTREEYCTDNANTKNAPTDKDMSPCPYHQSLEEKLGKLNDNTEQLTELMRDLLLAVKGDREMGHRGLVSRQDAVEEKITAMEKENLPARVRDIENNKIPMIESKLTTLTREAWIRYGITFAIGIVSIGAWNLFIFLWNNMLPRMVK